MAYSIIVITYQDKNLEKLLEQLGKLEEEKEIIVVNAGDTLNFESVKVINDAPKSRGVQLNLGAKIASFENLWFLHSDTKVPLNALSQIKMALQNSPIGCFRLKFDKKTFLLKVVAFFSNLRVRLRNIAFGDQGIFMTKEFYQKMDGFRDIAIMEDYEFSIRVKRRGVLFFLLDESIETSAKKFKKPWRTIFKMQLLQYKFRRGKSIDKSIKEIEDEYKKI